MSEQQKDLMTGRWRKIRGPNPLEYQLQISVIQQIRWRCRRRDVTCFHSPNGEVRDKRTAAKLKAMGVLPGVSDLIILFGWQVLFLELKSRGRKLTDEQKWFAKQVVDVHGHCFESADNIDDAVLILQRYQIII
jgi:hypothetical protein